MPGNNISNRTSGNSEDVNESKGIRESGNQTRNSSLVKDDFNDLGVLKS